MEQQRAHQGHHIGHHRFEQIDSLFGEHPGDECEDAVGSDRHHDADDLHHQLVHESAGPDEALGALTEHQRGDPDENRVEDDLQHLTLGEGLDRVGGDDAGDDLPERGRLFGFDARRVDAGHVESPARTDQLGDADGYADRQRGGHQVEPERLAADATQHPDVSDPGDAGDQREDHQRHDKQLECVQEGRADHVEEAVDDVVTDPLIAQDVEGDPHRQSGDHADRDFCGQ